MTDVMDEVAGERRDLADILDNLTESQWDAPSLCAGWRVREVVAHMTMPFRIAPSRFLLELAKSAGNFTKMSDRRAKQDAAALTPADLAAALRANIHHPWTPPGGGPIGALSHDVIHGLDITVPLGLDRQVPRTRLELILDALTPRQLRYFGVDLTGVQLRATDLDWTLGTGTPITAPAQSLLLLLSARPLPPGHLEGPAAERFTSR